MRLIWRHLVQDAQDQWASFRAFALSVGTRFFADATLFILLIVAPVVVVYSSRALPVILLFALLFVVLYGVTYSFEGRGPSIARGTLIALNPLTLPYWALALLAMILYGGLTAFWAIKPEPAAIQALKMWATFVVVVVLLRLMPPLDRERLRYTAPFGIALAAAILIAELATSGLLRPLIYGNNPAYLNRSVVTVSVLMWPALALTTGRFATAQKIGVVLLVAAAVIVSSSLSSLIGLCAGLIVMGLAFLSTRLATIGVVIVTAATFLAMPLAAKIITEFAFQTGVDTMVDLSSERRLEIWKAFSQAALEHPIIGWGLEASRFFGVRQLPGLDWKLGPVHHPHNPMLQVWVELGAIGVVLAVIAIIGVVLSIAHMPARRRPFAYGAAAAALTIGMVSHGAWQSWWTSLLMLLVPLFNIREDYPSDRPVQPVEADTPQTAAGDAEEPPGNPAAPELESA